MHNKIFTFFSLSFLFYIFFSIFFAVCNSISSFLKHRRFIYFKRTFLAQRGCWLVISDCWICFSKENNTKEQKKKKERNGVNVYFALEQLTAAKVNKYIFTTSANRYCYAVEFICLHDLFFQPQPFFLKLYFNVIE